MRVSALEPEPGRETGGVSLPNPASAGTSAQLSLPKPLLAAFIKKYAWDLTVEEQYNLVIQVTPRKWLGQ